MLHRDWKMGEKPLLMMKTNLHKLRSSLDSRDHMWKIPKSSLVRKIIVNKMI